MSLQESTNSPFVNVALAANFSAALDPNVWREARFLWNAAFLAAAANTIYVAKNALTAADFPARCRVDAFVFAPLFAKFATKLFRWHI